MKCTEYYIPPYQAKLIRTMQKPRGRPRKKFSYIQYYTFLDGKIVTSTLVWDKLYVDNRYSFRTLKIRVLSDTRHHNTCYFEVRHKRGEKQKYTAFYSDKEQRYFYEKGFICNFSRLPIPTDKIVED